ncbi:uncharacterized protein O3C94_008049 [Discoglossus pictus]
MAGSFSDKALTESLEVHEREYGETCEEESLVLWIVNSKDSSSTGNKTELIPYWDPTAKVNYLTKLDVSVLGEKLKNKLKKFNRDGIGYLVFNTTSMIVNTRELAQIHVYIRDTAQKWFVVKYGSTLYAQTLPGPTLSKRDIFTISPYLKDFKLMFTFEVNDLYLSDQSGQLQLMGKKEKEIEDKFLFYKSNASLTTWKFSPVTASEMCISTATKDRKRVNLKHKSEQKYIFEFKLIGSLTSSLLPEDAEKLHGLFIIFRSLYYPKKTKSEDHDRAPAAVS